MKNLRDQLRELDHFSDEYPIVIEIHEAVNPIHATMGELRDLLPDVVKGSLQRRAADAFVRFAEALPNNSVFAAVDTFVGEPLEFRRTVSLDAILSERTEKKGGAG